MSPGHHNDSHTHTGTSTHVNCVYQQQGVSEDRVFWGCSCPNMILSPVNLFTCGVFQTGVLGAVRNVFCCSCHNLFEKWCWHQTHNKNLFTKINEAVEVKHKTYCHCPLYSWVSTDLKAGTNIHILFHHSITVLSTFLESGLDLL